MPRRRFYVPPDSIRNGAAILPSGQAHHLRDVLRIKAGEVVEIFDGAGRGYIGEVEFRGSEVIARGLQSLPPEESRVRLTLAAALIKSAKFECILQKATELGVHEIIPLKTNLSNIRLSDDKIALRLERWERIVREAAKQCRRLAPPKVRAPQTLWDLLAAEEFSAFTRLLFYEEAPEPWRPGMLSERVLLCIGPEGGWESNEVKQARAAGCEIVHLGPWILRAETAAIAVISIVQHQLWNAGIFPAIAP